MVLTLDCAFGAEAGAFLVSSATTQNYERGTVLVPDPSVFVEDGKYYLIGTENSLSSQEGKSSAAVFPMYALEDLRLCRKVETGCAEARLLPRTNAFGKAQFWAPQIFRHKDRYYLAYTSDLHWGLAVSDRVGGPYRAHVEFPKGGGRIDPFVFVDDDGRIWAYFSDWKVEGNSGVAVVELTKDLKAFVGEPTLCVKNDRPWERKSLDPEYVELNSKLGYRGWQAYQSNAATVEGPTVLKRNGKYVLFYSANDFRSPDYCVCAAVADTPKGPWKKMQEGPVLSRAETGFNGTGHGDVFIDNFGAMWYVFHVHNLPTRVDPRRTGVVRLIETFGADGFPRYAADCASVRLLTLPCEASAPSSGNVEDDACSGASADEELSLRGIVFNGRFLSETERRDFADGYAVRYRLPTCKGRVAYEQTQWRLPGEATVWYQPECPEYERPYVEMSVGKIPVGTRINMPITAKLPDGTYRLLTEANVVDFTDSTVEYRGEGRFEIRYPANRSGFDRAGVPQTPWRVTLVAKDLQTLATSDIVRRLCPAPSAAVAARCAEFVRPGRCVWQWLPDGSPKYADQKAWYDRTKALGFEYYLIDDGWRDWRDGDLDQWACLKKWIDYGKSIGVGTFMWVHSKEMLSSATRRPYLENVKAAGAVGIKIDFMPPASCDIMRWYEETLADTLDFGLMTDFHGAVKPSGREKTWPHEVAREALRGHEWHITRYKRALPPEHDCILPFNRLVQGHADYTPMVFEEKELQGYTWARELAQGIIFAAPFLCLGDYPQNYLENPAVELIKALPVVYDETRILSGSEIGKCIVVAKRKGKDWFVAAENGASERTLSIRLDFLGSSQGELIGFADVPDRLNGYSVVRRIVKGTDTLDLMLRPCGGYVAWIRVDLSGTNKQEGKGK